jgi:hypothetical protein
VLVLDVLDAHEAEAAEDRDRQHRDSSFCLPCWAAQTAVAMVKLLHSRMAVLIAPSSLDTSR